MGTKKTEKGFLLWILLTQPRWAGIRGLSRLNMQKYKAMIRIVALTGRIFAQENVLWWQWNNGNDYRGPKWLAHPCPGRVPQDQEKSCRPQRRGYNIVQMLQYFAPLRAKVSDVRFAYVLFCSISVLDFGSAPGG